MTTEPSETHRPSAEDLAGSGHNHVNHDLSIVAGSLHEQYDARVGAVVVDTEIQLAADSFVDARIRSFVPLLVRRFANAKLRDRIGGDVMDRS